MTKRRQDRPFSSTGVRTAATLALRRSARHRSSPLAVRRVRTMRPYSAARRDETSANTSRVSSALRKRLLISENSCRARRKRELAVPSGKPSTSAISLTASPSSSNRTNTVRSSSADTRARARGSDGLLLIQLLFWRWSRIIGSATSSMLAWAILRSRAALPATRIDTPYKNDSRVRLQIRETASRDPEDLLSPIIELSLRYAEAAQQPPHRPVVLPKQRSQIERGTFRLGGCLSGHRFKVSRCTGRAIGTLVKRSSQAEHA